MAELSEQTDKSAAEASGLAALHLQNAMLTTLVMKGHLTMTEAASTFSGAVDSLKKVNTTPEARELVLLAGQMLKNSERGWKVQARGH
jgi:hypothetical protein